MLYFNKIISFHFKQSSTLNPKSQTCYELFGDKTHNNNIGVMGKFTPDSAFQSALLHSSISNILKLSTPVIGSYKTWCIPPGIIDQYWT